MQAYMQSELLHVRKHTNYLLTCFSGRRAYACNSLGVEAKGQRYGMGSLLPLGEVPGLNSGHWADGEGLYSLSLLLQVNSFFMTYVGYCS